MQADEGQETFALAIEVQGDGHALASITDVLAAADVKIESVAILDSGRPVETVQFELAAEGGRQELVASLEALPPVLSVSPRHSAHHVFGKRIVIIGGGAQVGQVAVGAISEADRHNLRGERISIDTIPLVGEREIAEAVQAAARLPRVDALVLAGALMGGDIAAAVGEVQAKGILVICLNMAGSVPDAADLVVTDPIQAGVMAVMAVAQTAELSLGRLGGRRF